MEALKTHRRIKALQMALETSRQLEDICNELIGLGGDVACGIRAALLSGDIPRAAAISPYYNLRGIWSDRFLSDLAREICRAGNEDVIKWFAETFGNSVFLKTVLVESAVSNHLTKVAKWLYETKDPKTKIYPFLSPEKLARQPDSIELLELIIDKEGKMPPAAVGWILQSGRQDLVEWLEKSSFKGYLYIYYKEDSLVAAVNSGKLELVNWIQEKLGIRVPIKSEYLSTLNLGVKEIDWLLSQKQPAFQMLETAIIDNNLRVAKILHERCQLTLGNASYGHLASPEMAEWVEKTYGVKQEVVHCLLNSMVEAWQKKDKPLLEILKRMVVNATPGMHSWFGNKIPDSLRADLCEVFTDLIEMGTFKALGFIRWALEHFNVPPAAIGANDWNYILFAVLEVADTEHSDINAEDAVWFLNYRKHMITKETWDDIYLQTLQTTPEVLEGMYTAGIGQRNPTKTLKLFVDDVQHREIQDRTMKINTLCLDWFAEKYNVASIGVVSSRLAFRLARLSTQDLLEWVLRHSRLQPDNALLREVVGFNLYEQAILLAKHFGERDTFVEACQREDRDAALACLVD